MSFPITSLLSDQILWTSLQSPWKHYRGSPASQYTLLTPCLGMTIIGWYSWVRIYPTLLKYLAIPNLVKIFWMLIQIVSGSVSHKWSSTTSMTSSGTLPPSPVKCITTCKQVSRYAPYSLKPFCPDIPMHRSLPFQILHLFKTGLQGPYSQSLRSLPSRLVASLLTNWSLESPQLYTSFQSVYTPHQTPQ